MHSGKYEKEKRRASRVVVVLYLGENKELRGQPCASWAKGLGRGSANGYLGLKKKNMNMNMKERIKKKIIKGIEWADKKSPGRYLKGLSHNEVNEPRDSANGSIEGENRKE